MIPLRDDVPSRTVPVLTVGFITLNVFAFLWQLSLGLDHSVLVGGVIPFEATRFVDIGPRDVVPPPLTALSSMWLHGGWLHLGGNMLFLWIFGNNVEDALGHGRYLLFYLAAGLVAAVAQIASDPSSTVPMVGASGAVAGVLGAYLLLYPRAQVLTLIPIFLFVRLVYLPAFLFIGFWFLTQVLAAPFGGQVAYLAHIGGFLFGVALGRPLAIRRERYLPHGRYWERG